MNSQTFYFPALVFSYLPLQSSSRTPTCRRRRGLRWWPCGASSWAWWPTGLRLWRRRCRGGAPSPRRPPASPPWTPTASRSTCSPTVRSSPWDLWVGLETFLICKIKWCRSANSTEHNTSLFIHWVFNGDVQQIESCQSAVSSRLVTESHSDREVNRDPLYTQTVSLFSRQILIMTHLRNTFSIASLSFEIFGSEASYK